MKQMPAYRWQDTFTLEIRSLRFFRIVLGILCLIDIFCRYLEREDFLGRYGVLQYSSIEKLGLSSLQTWSIHYYFEQLGLLNLIFIVHLICCAFFIYGWKPKLTGFIAWSLLVSLHNRTPFIQYGADTLLRMLLLWSLFLPLGTSLNSGTAQKQKIFCVGSIGLVLQVVLVYFTTVMVRTDPIWHTSRSALYFIFSIDQQVTWLGKALLQYQALLAYGTSAILTVELIVPLFVLVPFKIRFFRSVAIICLCALHLGIAFTMNLYWFSAVSLGSFIPLLQSNENKSLIQAPTTLLKDFVATILLIAMLGYNAAQWVYPIGRVAVPDILKAFVYLPRVDQEWKLYAPYPYKDDGWLRVHFVTPDNIAFSVQGLPGTAESAKPQNLADYFPDNRWRKLIFNVWTYRATGLPNDLAQYFCQKIQSYGYQKPERVIINYMLEITPDPGESGVITTEQIADTKCS